MEQQELKRVVEALIFAADAPLTAERIRETLPEELNGFDLDRIVEDLNRDYSGSGRAFFIRQIAGGYQVTTRPELHSWIRKLFLGRNKMRLSQAALETLAIVAFKQPISRVDVAQIRGVNSDGVIGTLLEKKLITISGRSEGVGRPLLYNTTPEFLQYFGVNDLVDLPKPREIEELIGKEGMPEEVLQALSDEKQLELPMELNVEGMESEETVPAAQPNLGEKFKAAAAFLEPEDDAILAAEEPSARDEIFQIEEAIAPDETTETEDDAILAAEEPTPLDEILQTEETIAADETVESEDAVEPEDDAILVSEEPIARDEIFQTEEAIAPDETVAAEDAAETEVDAILVEDPEADAAEFFEEQKQKNVSDDENTSSENGEGKKTAAPELSAASSSALSDESALASENYTFRAEPGKDFFLAGDRPAIAEKASSWPEEMARLSLSNESPAPEVHIVDLETLAASIPSFSISDETAAPENNEPASPMVAEQNRASEPVIVNFAEMTEAVSNAPVVHIVEIEQAEAVQAAPLQAEFAPDLEMVPQEQPRFMNAREEAAGVQNETPPFFVPAPPENGAQPAREFESGAMVFFKKAVGWIKNAWQKLVGR